MADFIQSLEQSLTDGSFVKLSLGDYKGPKADLKKVTVRPVVIKRESKLSFTYSYKTRDIVKNFGTGEGIEKISGYLNKEFGAAMLFTTEFNLSYPSLRKEKATIKDVPPKAHDRAKNRHVETKGKSYLQALKITDAKGEVFKNAQDKYRQIDKYVEIVAGLLKDAPKGGIRNIVDMGAGKGYLTFALYDYLQGQGMDAKVTGVEYRKDLVNLCNDIARQSGFENLSFVQGSIGDYDASKADMMIALHACDTATDDAIAKGIAAGAALIVVAPCCHKQIRTEMEKSKKENDLGFLLRHGTFMERQAEMVTDGLRSLILEYFGYTTKVFEFISDAHTPKNIMIVARRNARAEKKSPAIAERIAAVKAYFGISRHHLEEKTASL
ncbi:MAG TPA: SAM-dependent methyltransferase [Micavibrio sp.]|nr:SAM-dependent methyltransferase [Micavibrio sp.]